MGIGIGWKTAGVAFAQKSPATSPVPVSSAEVWRISGPVIALWIPSDSTISTGPLLFGTVFFVFFVVRYVAKTIQNQWLEMRDFMG